MNSSSTIQMNWSPIAGQSCIVWLQITLGQWWHLYVPLQVYHSNPWRNVWKWLKQTQEVPGSKPWMSLIFRRQRRARKSCLPTVGQCGRTLRRSFWSLAWRIAPQFEGEGHVLVHTLVLVHPMWSSWKNCNNPHVLEFIFHPSYHIFWYSTSLRIFDTC